MPTALIQGASRGIGLQFCHQLVSRGTTVIACCRNPGSADSLQALKEENPSLVNIVPLDVTSEAAIQTAAQSVRQSHTTHLDLLINCSGILSPTGKGETSLKEVSFKNLEETFAVNTFGPLLMGRHFSGMLQTGTGAVGRQHSDPKHAHAGVLVNMSARVGSITDNGLGGWYSYRMSKAALNMATKNLSVELARGRKKVICVALHPGTVDTDLSRPYHKNVAKGKLFTKEQSVSYLLSVIDNLSMNDTGKYLAFDGSDIPF